MELIIILLWVIMLLSFDEMYAICLEDNWGGNDEESLAESQIIAAEKLHSILNDCGVEAHSGMIEVYWTLSNKQGIMVLIGPHTHSFGFFTTNIELEKTRIPNTKIMETANKLLDFKSFYKWYTKL